jgi:SAM-dependent methyltransferase
MCARSAARKTPRSLSPHSRPGRADHRRPAPHARREHAHFREAKTTAVRQWFVQEMPDNFYDRIKPSLHVRIGRELRLARRVLDLGCGSCDLVKFLADAYCQEVTGVDISSGSFPSGRHTRGGAQFHCLKRDAVHLGFVDDRSVDAVVTMWALHEMEYPETILAETRRVLRPGGELLIVDYPRDSLAQKLWNENYYRPDEVHELLERAGFEDIRVRLIQRGQVMWVSGHQAGQHSSSQGSVKA